MHGSLPEGVEPEPRLFFTAPWDPIVVRRGDELRIGAQRRVVAAVEGVGIVGA